MGERGRRGEMSERGGVAKIGHRPTTSRALPLLIHTGTNRTTLCSLRECSSVNGVGQEVKLTLRGSGI
jgi:hypothetical protein